MQLTNTINYGDIIRTARIKRNLTPAELAKKLNMSSDMLLKYENGHRIPRSERLNKIFEILGVDVDININITIHYNNSPQHIHILNNIEED